MEVMIPFMMVLVLTIFFAAVFNASLRPWWHQPDYYWHWRDWAWWQRNELQEELADLRNELRTAKQAQQPPPPQQPAAPPPKQIVEHRHVVVHVNTGESHQQAPRKLIAQAEQCNAYVTKGAQGWEFHDKRTHALIAVQANPSRLLEAKDPDAQALNRLPSRPQDREGILRK